MSTISSVQLLDNNKKSPSVCN